MIYNNRLIPNLIFFQGLMQKRPTIIEKRIEISTKYEERKKSFRNKSKTAICSEVGQELGYSESGIVKIINRFLKKGIIKHKKPSGRKRKTTKRQDRIIKPKEKFLSLLFF